MGACHCNSNERPGYQGPFDIRNNPLWERSFREPQVTVASSLGVRVIKAHSTAYGQEVFAKIYTKDECDLEKVYHEISMLGRVDHPNVLGMLDVFQDRKHIILIFESFVSEVLLTYLNGLDKGIQKSTFDSLFIGLVSGVAHLHSKGIAHRNLDLDNVTVFERRMQIMGLKNGDYFRSRTDPSQHAKLWKESKQKLVYQSPEEVARAFDERADAWAVGVILYVLVYGEFPFDGDSNPDISSKIRRGNLTLETKDNSRVSEELRGIIVGLLNPNPTKRLSIGQLTQSSIFASHRLNYLRTVPKRCRQLLDLPPLSPFLFRLKVYITRLLVPKQNKFFAFDFFQIFEERHDGVFEFSQFEGVMREVLPEAHPQDVRNCFDHLDLHKDGQIKVTPFIAYIFDFHGWLENKDLTTTLLETFNVKFEYKVSVADVFDCLGMAPGDSDDDMRLVSSWVKDPNQLTPEDFADIIAKNFCNGSLV